MLKVFRQKGVAKKILWVVAGLIIVSFAFGFSVSQYSDAGNRNAAVGKVFGRTINMKEFRSYAQGVRDQALLTTGADFKKLEPFIDMENETWTRILIVKEAELRNIKVIDREVIASIAGMPAFQRDGRFDKQLYATILAHVFRRDARDFEESVRDQLKIAKLLQSSVGKINIPEEKIREEYEKRSRKVQVKYVLINPGTLASDLPVAEEDLKTYYDAHREEFLTPDAIKVQYVSLPLSEKSSLEDHKKVEATAEQIFQKAAAQGDLAATAKENGLELKETGFFNMNNPDLSAGWSLELLSQAFAAKTGSVLAPSVTPAGISIIKIAERQTARIPDFDQAKNQIKEKILSQKTMLIATQQAEEAHAALAAAVENKTDLSTAAQNAGLTPKETPFFSLGDYIPEIGLSEDFQSAAMATSPESPLSNVIQTSKGPVILWYGANQPIDDKKFEENKKDFTTTLYREESARIISGIVKDLREKAKMESYLKKADQKNN